MIRGEKEAKTNAPVYINGAKGEQLNSFKWMQIRITNNLAAITHLHPGEESL